MKLATIRTGGETVAVRVDEDSATELDAADVGAFLFSPNWRELARSAEGRTHDASSLDYAPLLLRPEKIVCVGLNYRSHITEMGRDIPSHPTLFAKFARSLVGAYDPIESPAGSDQVDWEAELGIVIGAEVRHADDEQALAAIAGYTVINDVTARDFQYRTPQWLQGKTFERSTPIGPWLVVDEGLPGVITCEVDGDVVQEADTADLVFSPPDLVAYISQFITLVPGDVIASGTPGGVGHARTPPRYLQAGAQLVTRIGGVGEQRNTVCAEA